jgi:hypothetical protein
MLSLLLNKFLKLISYKLSQFHYIKFHRNQNNKKKYILQMLLLNKFLKLISYKLSQFHYIKFHRNQNNKKKYILQMLQLIDSKLSLNLPTFYYLDIWGKV